MSTVAAAVAVWAASTLFRDVTGYLRTEFSFVLSAAIAAVVFSTTLGTRWMRPGAWLALGILGQAAALQWIDAGPLIHYQHLRSPEYLVGRIDIAVVLGLQSMLVIAGIRRRRKTIHEWLKRYLHGWRLWAAAAVILLPSAAVSRDVRFYAIELLLASVVQLINLGNLILIAASVPSNAIAGIRDWFKGWLGRDSDAYAPTIDKFAVAAALWVACIAALLSVIVYERHPHVPDEVSYLYHARYFAKGMLSMPVPAAPDAFDVDLLDINNGRWFSPVPPGWPAVLAIGTWFGVPWLVNPILSGLNILLAYLLVQYFETRRTARLVVLLLCVSPWYLFMGMNFMTHAFTLTCALLACCGVAESKRGGSFGWALLGGAGLGIGSLIRPLDGLIAAAIAGIWAISGRRVSFRLLAAMGISTVFFAGLTLPYNRMLTGNATKAPIMAYVDRHYGAGINDIGFGPQRGWGWQLDPYPGHTLFESFINDNLNTFSANVELFGWATGSLFLVVATLLFSRGERRRVDYAMLAAIAVVLAGYTFYWYSGGPDFGARYWFLAIIPLLVLSARGLRALEGQFGSRALVAIAFLGLMAVVNYMPWRGIDKYHRYLRMHPDVPALAAQHQFGRSLVLIRGERHPDFASAVIYNPLDLNADAPIYAWDKTPEARLQAIHAYPDRPIWVLDGPSRTGQGFRVVSGPTTAQSATVDIAKSPTHALQQ